MGEPVKGFARSLAALLAVGVALAAGLASARDPLVREDSPALVTALGELHSDPQSWLGKSVRLRFQVSSELDSWNPYLTRFGRADYRALAVWSDEQLLWEREAWEHPLGTLYVRRGGVAERALDGAPRLARFEAIGRVRQVFLGRPWIEIDQARRIGDEISEGTLLHATRALSMVEEQRWALAADHLDKALVGPMPPAARAALRSLRELAANPPAPNPRR